MAENANYFLLKGILSVISAVLHQFSIYPLFMMSNIIPFMISYLYHKEIESSKDGTSSIRQRDGYFIHPLMSLSMSLCCFCGGVAEHYLGPKASLFLGCSSIAIGDLLFVASESLTLDFFINIFFGIGFGISMMASVKNASKYFPQKRGLINAIAGGFGGNLGSSAFNLVIKYFVSKGDYPRSEDNDMYLPNTAKNYKYFFYIHASVIFFFGIISCILLIPYEKVEIKKIKPSLFDKEILDKSEEEDIENKNLEVELIDKVKNLKDNLKPNSKESKGNYKTELKYILVHFRIYYLLLIFLFTSFLQGFILTVGFNFGTMDHNKEETSNNNRIGADEMSMIFMLMSLLSCFLGPIYGIIYDKLGFKITIIVINVISIINGCLIFFTARWGVIFYGISIIVNGSLNSGAFSLIFPYVSKIFGFAYAGELYGIVVLSPGISSIVSSSVYYIFSKIMTINSDTPYLIMFMIGAFLNFIALVLSFFEKNESFQINDKNKEENKNQKNEEHEEKENESKNEV